jgi:hypothetical protein
MPSLRNTGDNEPGPEYDAEVLTDVSTDEHTVDAPQDENEVYRRIRRLKNAKRAKCRWNTENHARNPLYERNLNNAFAVAEDQCHCRSSAPSSTTTTRPPRLQYLTQHALVQLHGQRPMFSTRNTL